MMVRSELYPRVPIDSAGSGVVSHAGAVVPVETARATAAGAPDGGLVEQRARRLRGGRTLPSTGPSTLAPRQPPAQHRAVALRPQQAKGTP